MSETVLFSEVEVDGVVTSLRVRDGVVTEIAPGLSAIGDETLVDGDGAALIPGLHDHHLHLAAMAAADRSVHLSGDLDAALRRRHGERPTGEWLRAVGYDEVSDGPLDRSRLDALAPGRAVRVQHRSGAMWVLSTTALEVLGLGGDVTADDVPDGVEYDPDGSATGRVFRADDWLGARRRALVVAEPAPDVAAVARRLARYGVTGVTDATPSSSPDEIELLADPEMAVSVVVTGSPALVGAAMPRGVEVGPVKVVIGDHALPDLDVLVQAVDDAHRAGRAVAVHCVTRVALALAVAMWDAAGARPGDRLEHGSVMPLDLVARVRELGVVAVTQPAFVRARGDAFLADVDAEDLPHLYRCGSLLEAGVPVGGSTDAPFGPEDPWVAMAAAVDRRTNGGALLGPDEAVTALCALRLFLSARDDPGGVTRRVVVGSPADLCLLDAPLAQVLSAPSSDAVRGTWRAGRRTFD